MAMIAWARAALFGSRSMSRTNERSILSVLIGKALQVAQRRVAGAEIVDRQAQAQGGQLLQPARRLGRVAHDHALGQLELEQVGRHARFLDRGGDRGHQVLLLELPGRDVDRELQPRVAHAVPAPDLGAGGAQHPGADRHDQAGLLGQRDELGRRHQAEVGMVPAQQRLDAEHGAVGEADLGLVVDHELALLERLPQPALQHQPLEGGRVHVVGVELVVVAALLLGAATARCRRS